jgi:effector-binding domain-containing protein
MEADQSSDGVQLEELEPQAVVSIRQNVKVADLTNAQGESLRALWEFMQRHDAAPAGPFFVRYHSFGSDEADMEIGVPVAAPPLDEGRVARGELPGGTAITTLHLGSHDGLGNAYGSIQAWVKEHRREVDGAGWEIYEWIDPAVEPDPSSWPAPSDWRTKLVQPIK